MDFSKSFKYLLTALAFCLPVSISGVQFMLVALLMLLLYLAFTEKTFRKCIVPHRRLLLFLLVAPLFSLINAQDIAVALKWYKRYCYILSIVVIASSFVQSKEKEEFILSGYVLAASGAAVVGILQPFLGKSFELPFNIKTYYVFSTGFVSQSNAFGEIMTFSAIAALYLLYTTTQKHQRILLSTGIISMFLATIFSRARASIAVFTIILLIFIPYILKKHSIYFFSVIFIIMLMLSPYTERIFWRFDNILSSGNARIELWEKSLETFSEHSIVGCGIGNLKDCLLKKANTIKNKRILKLKHAHNNLIDMLATTGLVGFLAFILFWFAVFKDIIIQIKYSTGDRKALYIAILTVVIAFHLVGMVNCNYKTAITAFQVYLFIGMFYGIKEKSVA